MPVALIIVILLAGTTHIRRSSGARGKAISSILLLAFTAMTVFISGDHKCEEGVVPPFIACAFSVFVAGLPWVLASRPWLMRGAVALAVLGGIFMATGLANSYHQDAITGNPKFASGRFWHTRLTGQYPRDPEQTYKARLARDITPPSTTTTNSGPTARASKASAAQP